MNKLKKNKGITMVALIVTIIILLILAGISIGVLTGENGLIRNARESKEQTEIANEREVIDQATIQAMEKHRYGDLTKENLQNSIDEIIGEEKVDVSDLGENFEIYFPESKRYYEVDKDGNIGEYKIAAQDQYPGDITKDENGNILDGSAEKPYEINCIEDLVAFSNMTNGMGIKLEDDKTVEITTQNYFQYKNIILKRSLNFLSKYSYIDSERTDFGDINGNDADGNVLIKEMATERGFRCINIFQGEFDGKNNIIENIYVNTAEENIGLFKVLRNGAIISNFSLSGEIIGKSNVGGIAGIITTEPVTIENCINKCKVSGSRAVGGICGRTNIKALVINNCKNEGKIISNETGGGSGFGGIIGVGDLNIISNCVNEGTIYISVSNDMNTGGIIGTINYNGTAYINNSYNKGKIENGTMLGAIVGYIGANGNLEMINVTYKSDIENAIGVSSGTVVGEATTIE